MLKLVQLFSSDEFTKKLRTSCSKIDSSLIVNQTDASLYFSNINEIRRDLVFLIDRFVIENYFNELHQLSVSNFMVYVYSHEDEIYGQKMIENLADGFIPFQFKTINLYTTISLAKKTLHGHSATIFPRKLINTSVSEIEKLINSVSQRVFWKNKNGQYIGCNSLFARDFDFENIEDIIGKTDEQLFDETNAREFSAYDIQILKTGESVDAYEKEILFKNGSNRWLRILKYPHTKEGQVIGVIGIYEDVEKLHSGNSTLLSDQKILELLMDNIPDTIYFKDNESRFIKINKAQADLLGVESNEEAFGKSDFDFFDNETAKESFAAEQRIIFDGEQVNHLEYLGTKDGQFRWMNSLKVPIKDEHGNSVGIVGISRDVEDMVNTQKQLEAERDLLQLLIDNLPSPIFFKDKNFVITRANKALANLLGEASANEIIGKTYLELLPSEEALQFVKDERRILETGVPIVNRVEKFVGKTMPEKEKWFSTTKIPVKNKEGENVAIVGLSHDITDQILTKQQLELAKKKAEEASLAKSNFLSNMSHEIRTPMNGIIGMADVLSLSELDEDQQRIVDIIMRSGNNLLNIINDILDLSKIEAGKLIIEKAPVNIHDLVQEVRELTEYVARENKIELLVKIDSNIPEQLLGDSLRVKQVLLNLVSNAIKFTPKGSVTIDVKALGSSDEKYCIQMSITDTGIGMNQEQLKHVFDTFAQADSSTTRKYGGTGLGLSISQRLIEMMGGKLKVESEVDKGSCFYFELFLDKIVVSEHNYM